MREFIKPWMIKCNPDLILRYWRSKGSSGKVTLTFYGVTIEYSNTPFGELVKIVRPNLDEAYKWIDEHLNEIFQVR